MENRCACPVLMKTLCRIFRGQGKHMVDSFLPVIETSMGVIDSSAPR